MIYTKILAPHDGSSSSEKAVEHAMELAKVTRAQIVFLHIIPSIPIPPFIDRTNPSFKTDKIVFSMSEHIKRNYLELRERAFQMLEEKKERCEVNGITVKLYVLSGQPVENILALAKTEKIDLIVMGTVRLKGLSKIKAFGSVARRVSENAACAVLLIH